MGLKEPLYADIMALHLGVTGSCFLVVVKYPNGETTKFIVDCGLFQEAMYAEYNKTFPFDAENIKFCLITHNHVDHVGRLPLLAKNRFEGKIYLSKPTSSLIGLALGDSYKVLKDLAKRKHEPQLYSEADVGAVLKKLVPCEFENVEYIDKNIKVTFFKNAHLIGAALILVTISYPGYKDINLLFTGDYNNKNMFLDLEELPDWVKELPLTIVQESTYGTMESTQIEKSFQNNIKNRIDNGGTAVCLAFSLGRMQEILYILKTMQESGELSVDIPIYADGKLGLKYTSLYRTADLGIKEEMRDFLPKNLKLVDKESRPTVVESTETKIIVTTSGMGTYGPAQVYIPEYIKRDNALIQFTGFTPEGTLGAQLKFTEKGDVVTVGGVVLIKRADVEYTTEFSAHAKANEMIEFLKKFKNPQLILVNHGEADVKNKFAERIAREVEPKNVAVLGRDYFFRVGPYGLIRSLSTKFN